MVIFFSISARYRHDLGPCGAQVRARRLCKGKLVVNILKTNLAMNCPLPNMRSMLSAAGGWCAHLRVPPDNFGGAYVEDGNRNDGETATRRPIQ